MRYNNFLPQPWPIPAAKLVISRSVSFSTTAAVQNMKKHGIIPDSTIAPRLYYILAQNHLARLLIWLGKLLLHQPQDKALLQHPICIIYVYSVPNVIMVDKQMDSFLRYITYCHKCGATAFSIQSHTRWVSLPHAWSKVINVCLFEYVIYSWAGLEYLALHWIHQCWLIGYVILELSSNTLHYFNLDSFGFINVSLFGHVIYSSTRLQYFGFIIVGLFECVIYCCADPLCFALLWIYHVNFCMHYLFFCWPAMLCITFNSSMFAYLSRLFILELVWNALHWKPTQE